MVFKASTGCRGQRPMEVSTGVHRQSCPLSPQGCLSSCCAVLHALTAAPNPSRPGGTGSSLHCPEPPGLKASLAPDSFQYHPLEPLFPRGPCSLLQAKGTSYQ